MSNKVSVDDIQLALVFLESFDLDGSLQRLLGMEDDDAKYWRSTLHSTHTKGESDQGNVCVCEDRTLCVASPLLARTNIDSQRAQLIQADTPF
jgi:hypothetical protein